VYITAILTVTTVNMYYQDKDQRTQGSCNSCDGKISMSRHDFGRAENLSNDRDKQAVHVPCFVSPVSQRSRTTANWKSVQLSCILQRMYQQIMSIKREIRILLVPAVPHWAGAQWSCHFNLPALQSTLLHCGLVNLKM